MKRLMLMDWADAMARLRNAQQVATSPAWIGDARTILVLRQRVEDIRRRAIREGVTLPDL